MRQGQRAGSSNVVHEIVGGHMPAMMRKLVARMMEVVLIKSIDETFVCLEWGQPGIGAR